MRARIKLQDYDKKISKHLKTRILEYLNNPTDNNFNLMVDLISSQDFSKTIIINTVVDALDEYVFVKQCQKNKLTD